ncbi:hypothetical protein EUGRSUZ_C03361 [Eucalyptus grandis]|uniref:Uncharacterized protein n=2 Tax=Eucalyptus grandis TaxID=71139 RepID=A0ACC3LJJ4_EUCGR|nr:hypothetical protein EUGRSUZ_C03361 [Eucalyptus grandis]
MAEGLVSLIEPPLKRLRRLENLYFDLSEFQCSSSQLSSSLSSSLSSLKFLRIGEFSWSPELGDLRWYPGGCTILILGKWGKKSRCFHLALRADGSGAR